MSNDELPTGWSCRQVGELFDMQLGKMLSKQASAGPGQRPYLANRHVQWERVDLNDLDSMSFTAAEREKYRLLSGDLLVCEGGEVGRTALWTEDGTEIYFQKAIHRLRPRDGAVAPGFMLRHMRHAAARGRFTDLTSQSSIAHLTQEKLSLLQVGLPPLPEQRRIAEILDTLDEAIRRTEQVIAKLQQMKQGLLHDLLTRGIDENGELRDPERSDERSWRSALLGELLFPVREPGVEGVPTVAVTLTEGLVRRNDDERRVETALRAQQHLLVRRGDIAYNMMRMWQGACGLAMEDCLVSPAYVVLRMRDALRPRFAYRLFKSPAMIAAFLVHSRGITSDRYRLYPQDLLQIGTRVPQDPDEQERIADIADGVDDRLAEEHRDAAKLRSLKAGLMDDLLTGRVRVRAPEEASA